MAENIRLAIISLAVGFSIEAAAGILQITSYGSAYRRWIGLYYVGLVTTGLGLFLLYRGWYRWTELHPGNALRRGWFLRAVLAILVGAVAAIAVLSTLQGQSSGTPLAVAWLVGGLISFALGTFFLSLVLSVDRLVGRFGRLLAAAGFGWSLGVAVLTGLVVGGQFGSLLRELLTDPLGLIVSSRPLASVIALLFVSYLLFAGAFAEACRRLPTSLPWVTRRRGPFVPRH